MLAHVLPVMPWRGQKGRWFAMYPHAVMLLHSVQPCPVMKARDSLRDIKGLDQPPVRLCCDQRHLGLACPDGKIMCCLCFSRFNPEDLHVDSFGTRWDVCEACHQTEKLIGERKRTTERTMD